MPYEEKYFEFDGQKLRYFRMGSGKPILFLHGFGLNALTYKKILDSLAHEYLVIAPDLPGFGKSGINDGNPNYFEILKKFASSLGRKNIAVVGHSFGGAAALELAAGNKNIPFLVLVDSLGFPPKITKARFIFKYLNETIRDFFSYGKFKAMISISKDFFANLSWNFHHRKYMTDTLEKFLSSDFGGFGEVRAKTLILWGKKDEMFPAYIAENLHSKISDSEVRYSGGGHAWCIFEPKRFSNMITGWLKENNY